MSLKGRLLMYLLFFLAGYFVANSNIEVKEEIRYKELPPLFGSVNLEPTSFKPKNVNLPTYIYKLVVKDAEIDTLALLEQLYTLNQYKYTLFDNKFGKLDVKQDVQFNRIVSTDYKFYPIQREVTKIVNRRVKPIFTAGVSNSFASLGAGLIINKIGVEYRYMQPFNNNFPKSHYLGVVWLPF